MFNAIVEGCCCDTVEMTGRCSEREVNVKSGELSGAETAINKDWRAAVRQRGDPVM